jgi:hypothetical protein
LRAQIYTQVCKQNKIHKSPIHSHIHAFTCPHIHSRAHAIGGDKEAREKEGGENSTVRKKRKRRKRDEENEPAALAAPAATAVLASAVAVAAVVGAPAPGAAVHPPANSSGSVPNTDTRHAGNSGAGSIVISYTSSNGDARSWTEQQVAEWLAGIGTAYADAKYGDAFVASGVNGKLLLDGIEEEDLISLGVTSRLHRKRIMQDIAELRVCPAQASKIAGFNINKPRP